MRYRGTPSLLSTASHPRAGHHEGDKQMTSSQPTTTPASTPRKAPARSSLNGKSATVTPINAAATEAAAAKAAHPSTMAKKKPARKPAAKRAAGWLKPATVPLNQLIWEWREDAQQSHAVGAKRYYRVTRTGNREWFAFQKGSSTWTPIAGVCSRRAEAQELAQRYENGA